MFIVKSEANEHHFVSFQILVHGICDSNLNNNYILLVK